jgi:hypothetical protein
MAVRILSLNDLEFVQNILTHESIYENISDDMECNKDILAETALSNGNMLLISPNEFTIFLLSRINLITVEVHTCILPEGRGDIGIKAGKESIRWVFENTGYKKIISWVPSFNKQASLYAIECGFRREGVCKNSFQKDNIIFDMILYGIEKES